ncbi:histidine triad nucleotide-binding protein [Croceicoccus gelatinilyticus]|uniref:histidine triad nucleotide-binding protein n=1 Tax=Croceicoccus gelatinilyticus TaxID=2835536 RepID=UPI001BCADDAC|nr:histidine triad nucleotide-binding protein [Croceicoccus gelatinilyticus]MBS7668556.1 histidine triad nucleotide-binding protein [Croceicoccus gelatinilyticus]
MSPVDPTAPYDDNNIFAKILRGELPCTKVYEDEWAFAFEDIAPVAPIHILVVPKGKYVSWDDFSVNAPADEIAGFVRAVGKIAREKNLVEVGYRLINNIGPNGGQIVPHLHVHLMGGRVMGPMLTSA